MSDVVIAQIRTFPKLKPQSPPSNMAYIFEDSINKKNTSIAKKKKKNEKKRKRISDIEAGAEKKKRKEKKRKRISDIEAG